MIKVALIGDSIFDNGAYVAAGGEVITHLKHELGGKGDAILVARDGAVVADVPKQLSALPDDVTHLAVSVGGNDALRNIDVLARPARSIAEALSTVADVRDDFLSAYAQMLDKVAELGIPTILCTIYDVQLPDPAQRRAANLALVVFNDSILREASSRKLPVVDLRVIFDEPDDYANAIEPSGRGAAKIASVINQISTEHEFRGSASLYSKQGKRT
ncbi:SGNH/GDSL hydrolase family protein [Rhizobium deserti]|uniref:SGNH/GDSL hydrolase family protein n=2 Tax=Rhizobium deserti TaxID=2547961 RepID=A0A4R5UPR9_9HYPH|nr:SGNH/GDSL hydrolase family protein [Rhizobium deserti]